ncbi:TIGR02679 family protein [Caldimonas tepidiphila]|uniref:TIGR02679 family protein n=1 Tax=Caldimonas tepidiphila TaxID=2315841 RepID=UPI000E5C4EF5|nr:TIGR02679 family protein [Caldimonas tepidiphila]
MSRANDPRLLRLLGGEGLAALRQRLRRRFEQLAPGTALPELRLAQLAPHEHEALARLLGRPAARPAASMLIDVARIDDALRQAGIASSLREALERLDGPILDRAALRDEEEARWQSVIDGCGHPALARLLALPEGLGLLRRLSGRDAGTARSLCRRAAAVLERLPAAGLPRAQLAAEVLGDAHALDAGQPTATLVLAAWRRVMLAAGEDGNAGGEQGSASAEERRAESEREVWASAGVLVNELARPALFLNLPVDGESTGRAPPGEPAYLSLRALLRSPPRWAVRDVEVHVCENPNLVAIAADRLGAGCAPLVCTDGMPAAAQRLLLTQLALAGARLRCHADFDWAGLRIAAHVMREHGAQPWRFGAADYEAAAEQAPRPGQGLQGTPAEAPWDAALAAAMRRQGLAIAEEAVAGPLLGDLAR